MTDRKPQHHTKHVRAGIGLRSPEPEVHFFGAYARGWYEDAIAESQKADGRAIRREIVLAVCFAESYLLEWVRDSFAGRPDTLARYFPDTARSGVWKRWKQVVKSLAADGLINAAPDFEKSGAWQEFRRLVEFRNGLTHGQASRPHDLTGGIKPTPFPTSNDLAALPGGWPVKTVKDLILETHQSAGSSPPSWL